MTPEIKAHEWANKAIPQWIKDYHNKKYYSSAGKAVEEMFGLIQRAYIAGASEASPLYEQEKKIREKLELFLAIVGYVLCHSCDTIIAKDDIGLCPKCLSETKQHP